MFLSFKDYSIYSNRRKSKWKNNGFRTLYESVIPNEVLVALDDWKSNQINDCVLIGALALSYYIKPRYTEDIDLIFLSEEDIPNYVYKFRKNRAHSFEHIKTGVEVELITPVHINKGVNLFNDIFRTAVTSDGIKIASPLGLIALKLFRSRYKERDRLDIIELCRYCKENNIDIDLSNFNLTDDEHSILSEIVSTIDFDSISENMYMLELKSYLRQGNFEKINIGDYDIYIFQENYGEPRFHFGKNIDKKVKKYSDFQFSISLTKTFSNNDFRVLESTTEYKSFNGFESEREILNNWLTDKNLNKIKYIWQKLNKSRNINLINL